MGLTLGRAASLDAILLRLMLPLVLPLKLLLIALAGAMVSIGAWGSTVPYASCFERSAQTHEVSAVLLKAVAATESNYNPNARSSANAHGLMQIQWPGTARHLGVRRVAQLYSPCNNIDLGARYLRELLDRYDDNERRALAAYNYGPGRIKASGALPAGAIKYVATVHRHRSALVGRAVPLRPENSRPESREPKPASETQPIVSFSSMLRARRYAALLQGKMPSATFAVRSARFGRHAVVLVSDVAELSADNRILLTSFGWEPQKQ